MSVLAIIISIIALFTAVGLLAYHHFKPAKEPSYNSKKLISEENLISRDSESNTKKSKLTAEQQKIIDAEKKRRLAEQEAERKKQQDIERKQRVEQNLTDVTNAVSNRDWIIAEVLMDQLVADEYPAAELSILNESITLGKMAEKEDIRQVDEILESVKLLDNGEYSPEAIKMLDVALDIYPEYKPTIALKRKIDAYPYSLRVPEDVATIIEAAHKLRKGDTILLGEGKHKLTSALAKGVKIKGKGQKLTSIQCLTREGSALALTGGGEEYVVSDLTIEGLSYEDDALERYPLVLVKSKVRMENVTVEKGSGHGIAVAGGSLKMTKCVVTANSWDGVSVIGEESFAEISDSEISSNYEHGVDFWDGAKGKLTNLKVYENVASGVVVMGKGTNVKIEQVQAMRNRHCGILINAQAEASLERVFSSENSYSGIVIQGQGTKVKCGITVSNNNQEAGYFISPSAIVENFITATSEGNSKGMLIKADLIIPSPKLATP